METAINSIQSNGEVIDVFKSSAEERNVQLFFSIINIIIEIIKTVPTLGRAQAWKASPIICTNVRRHCRSAANTDLEATKFITDFWTKYRYEGF